ncbi:hypothetical protein N7475_008809 [Penicillium sp. IBT 31633x]|nr:hypothetical protein N7475_008809 [Penicillium sp. IBT 31633x]
MSSSRLPLTAPCSSVVESKTLARSLECGVIPAVVYRCMQAAMTPWLPDAQQQPNMLKIKDLILRHGP